MFKEWSAVPAHVAALGQPNRGHHYEEGRIQDNHGQHQKSPSDTEVISIQQYHLQVTQRDYRELAGAIWDFVDR